jgi:Cohesin loading factor
MQLYEAIICCIHTNWNPARKTLSKLESQLRSQENQNFEILLRWISYLNATIEQGTGNTEAAKQIYISILEENVPKASLVSKRQGSTLDDLTLLCRLNLLLVLHSPEKSPTQEAQSILQDLLDSAPAEHPNPAIRSAMALITTIINPREAIIKKKTSLQQALTGSRTINNGQLLAVTMAAMVGMFFADIVVGGQARKSRATARALAKKGADPLWIGVTGGLALQGETEKAEQNTLWEEIEESLDGLEEKAKERFINTS